MSESENTPTTGENNFPAVENLSAEATDASIPETSNLSTVTTKDEKPDVKQEVTNTLENNTYISNDIVNSSEKAFADDNTLTPVVDDDGDASMRDATPTPTPAPFTIKEPTSTPQADQPLPDPEAFLSMQLKPVALPIFSRWFSFDSINELEKKSLPQFFNSQSLYHTPQAYQKIRNFIIQTWRLNPNQYLTITAARKNVAADIESVVSIHRFLSKWGLINYNVDGSTIPSALGPQSTRGFSIVLDTPVGIQALVPEVKQTDKGKSLGIKRRFEEDQPKQNSGMKVEPDTITKDEDRSLPLNMELRKNIYDPSVDSTALQDENQLRINDVNNKTFTCYLTGSQVTDVHFNSLRYKGVNGHAINGNVTSLKNGGFPTENNAETGIVNLEDVFKKGGKLLYPPSIAWTDQELVLLLEGIEMFEDNWEQIADHVGTRDKSQCITRYVQLPIDEQYITKKKIEMAKKNKKVGGKLEMEKVISFLTNYVDENLAKKVAQKLRLKHPEKNPDNFFEDGSTMLTKASTKLSSKQTFSDISTVEDQALLKQQIELTISKFQAKLSQITAFESQISQSLHTIQKQKRQILNDKLSLQKQAILVLNSLQKTRQLTLNTTGNVNSQTSPLMSELNVIVNTNTRALFKKRDDRTKKDSKDNGSSTNGEIVAAKGESKLYNYWFD